MDPTPLVLFLILLGIGVEIGGILVFRTLTGMGPRPSKLLTFAAAGVFLSIAMFLAHLHVDVVIVLGVLGLAFLAQAWHVWQMCKRHWAEWQRRRQSRES